MNFIHVRKGTKMARKKRRRRGRKRGFAAWSAGKKIGVVVGCLFLALLVTGTLYAASKIGKLETTTLDANKLNISEETEVQATGYTNVALFGLDSREGDLGKGNRSDTIMIASLNNETKEIRLVSVYRDTLMELDDGSYNKANAAYSFGGPEGAISMINRNMDMNIEKYVAVNFNALVDVIDALGGVDITMTAEEVVHMNNYCVETSEVTGVDYTRIEPEVAGTYHLNGVQAVSYSRIRYTAGGDFERASRQRLVLSLIAEKAQSMSIGQINKIIDSVFPQISTNFTLTEMLAYAADFQKYKMGDSLGFPSENTSSMLSDVGSVVIPNTLSSNLKEVHFFLFSEESYTASSRVQEIESGIELRAEGTSDVSDDYEDYEDYGGYDDYESWDDEYDSYDGYGSGSGTNSSRDNYDSSGGYNDYTEDDTYDDSYNDSEDYYVEEDSSYWE